MSDNVLERVTGLTRSGDGWLAQCPAHADRHPSLSIGRGDDGRWLLTCHAGCTVDDILGALKLDRRDLFPSNGTESDRRIVAVYNYGSFEVVRYDPKTFRQRRPDGNGGYIWNMQGVVPALYHHDDLTGHETVIVAEGEKDVDRLRGLGLRATCNAGGAGKWKSAYTQQLVDAGVQHVVVIPDADRAGQAHGHAVAESCAAAGLTVKVVALPDGVKDVSAYLDAPSHTPETLRGLLQAASVYTPAEATSSLPPGWCLLGDVEATTADGPPVVARGLAWAGRLTLLHAREKVGKSTLIGAAVAAITHGASFLERPTRQGPVVWFGEEHSGDVKKRLTQWGADCQQIAFGSRLTRDPDDPASLRSIVAHVRPVLVVVDTLTLFANVLGIRDLHGAGELGAALTDLVVLARQTEATVVILHHNRKNPSVCAETGDRFGEYRDSTAIGAAVDMIVSLSHQHGGARTARRLTLQGRWHESPLVVTLGSQGFTLHPDPADDARDADMPLPLRERVLLLLRYRGPTARPGTIAIGRALNCGTGGRKLQELKLTLERLVDAGAIDHDQRPGTTGRTQQGYALTAAGRAIAHALHERLLPLPHRGDGRAEVDPTPTSTSANGTWGGSDVDATSTETRKWHGGREGESHGGDDEPHGVEC